jgi:hypothetical protein
MYGVVEVCFRLAWVVKPIGSLLWCVRGCVERVMRVGVKSKRRSLLSVKFCDPGRRFHAPYRGSNGEMIVYSYPQ